MSQPLLHRNATRDGIIRFRADHTDVDLPAGRFEAVWRELESWRELLRAIGVLGQEPGRYGNAGFGNLSARVGAPSAARGERGFLISGTQTGRLAQLELHDYAWVRRTWPHDNRVRSEGRCLPSSESMTHGALYDLNPSIRYVFHGHAPTIWRTAAALGVPTTRADVEYGTPDMADEVARVWGDSSLADRGLLVMAGHEDGVITFGRTAEEAGLRFVAAWVAARAVSRR